MYKKQRHNNKKYTE